MASRTKQKEEARARRLAEEQARAERAQRTRRLRMLAGVVIAAVAVVAVVIVISVAGSSPSSGPKPGSKGAVKESAAVDSLLSGIPQSGETLGFPNAPVTVIEYGDLECPICRAFSLTGEQQLISNQVRSGKVKIVYRSFETATHDPTTFLKQQTAAYAAGLQNKAWYYILLFYHEQGQEGTGYATSSYLNALATQVPGMSYSQWASQSSDSTLSSEVTAQNQQALSSNFQGTPTLIFQGPKGQTQPVSGDLPYSDLQTGINAVS